MRGGAAFLSIGVLLVGCTRSKATVPPTLEPQPTFNADSAAVHAWASALARATALNESGEYAAADAELWAFRSSTPALALESDFWRALFRADPRRGANASAEARALFDAYLTAGPSAPRYAEAALLRRLLSIVDSARSASQQLRNASEAQRRTRDEEIKKLSEDLDRTMAELDRIKRRLVPGGKPTPHETAQGHVYSASEGAGESPRAGAR